MADKETLPVVHNLSELAEKVATISTAKTEKIKKTHAVLHEAVEKVSEAKKKIEKSEDGLFAETENLVKEIVNTVTSGHATDLEEHKKRAEERLKSIKKLNRSSPTEEHKALEDSLKDAITGLKDQIKVREGLLLKSSEFFLNHRTSVNNILGTFFDENPFIIKPIEFLEDKFKERTERLRKEKEIDVAEKFRFSQELKKKVLSERVEKDYTQERTSGVIAATIPYDVQSILPEASKQVGIQNQLSKAFPENKLLSDMLTVQREILSELKKLTFVSESDETRKKLRDIKKSGDFIGPRLHDTEVAPTAGAPGGLSTFIGFLGTRLLGIVAGGILTAIGGYEIYAEGYKAYKPYLDWLFHQNSKTIEHFLKSAWDGFWDDALKGIEFITNAVTEYVHNFIEQASLGADTVLSNIPIIGGAYDLAQRSGFISTPLAKEQLQDKYILHQEQEKLRKADEYEKQYPGHGFNRNVLVSGTTDALSESRDEELAKIKKISDRLSQIGAAQTQYNNPLFLKDRQTQIPASSGELAGTTKQTQQTIENLQKNDLLKYVYKYAAEEGVDPKLVLSIISTESGGKLSATSNTGVKGVMQLTEKTGKRFGVDRNASEEDNIKGGVRYLKWLLDYFHGDEKLAILAYNGGETAVKNKLDFGTPFPRRETDEYLPKVLKAESGFTIADHPSANALTDQQRQNIKLVADLDMIQAKSQKEAGKPVVIQSPPQMVPPSAGPQPTPISSPSILNTENTFMRASSSSFDHSTG